MKTSTSKSTSTTFKTLGYKITSNALVISYENEKGERKKTYTFNCAESKAPEFAKLLQERLDLSTNEYIMNEAKKLSEKWLLINLKEARDEIEDRLESLVG